MEKLSKIEISFLINGKLTLDFLTSAPDQHIDTQYVDVMLNIDDNFEESGLFENHFSLSDVQKAVGNIKCNPAVGVDEIPGEVLKNHKFISVLHKLCNMCYRSRKVPNIWGKSVIGPIPKCKTSEPRDPLSYRDKAITPVVYNVCHSLLNEIINSWTDLNIIIFEGQHGFSKGRSTIDHISY